MPAFPGTGMTPGPGPPTPGPGSISCADGGRLWAILAPVHPTVVSAARSAKLGSQFCKRIVSPLGICLAGTPASTGREVRWTLFQSGD